MSIYSDLLKIALDQSAEVEAQLTSAGTLAVYLRSRAVLQADVEQERPWESSDKLFAELDYDIALIRVCRLVGIASAVQAFDQPGAERARLEQALVARGIRLDELKVWAFEN